MKTQPKRVSFQDDVKVIEIPCRSSWSTHDLSAMYYSLDDLKEFRQRERLLSKMLSSYGQLDSLDCDETGRCTVEARNLRQKRTLDAILIVLQEQYLQCYFCGKRNPDSIAKAYSGATIESSLFARHRAYDIALQVLEQIDEEAIAWSYCTNSTDSNAKEDAGLGALYVSTPTRKRQPAVRSRTIVIPLD